MNTTTVRDSDMRPLMRPILIVPALGLLLAGCAAPPRDQGFSDVSTAVQERAGTGATWNRGSAEDRQVAASVRERLAQDLTPDAAVQIALLNNPRLHATYQELGISQAELVQAGLLSNPTLSAGVKFFGEGPMVDLGLTQNLISVFLIPARKRIAEADLAAAKQHVLGEILSLIGDTRRAALAVLAAQQRLELRETVFRTHDASFDLARRIHDAGNSSDLRFAGEQAAYEQAKLDFAAAENEVQDARENLTVLLGLWGPDVAAWKMPGRLPDLPSDAGIGDGTGLEKTAIARSTALAAARERVRGIGERFGIERLDAWFGDVEIGVTAEREPTGEWGVGPEIGVSLPIFDQGQGRRAAATAELEQSAQAYIAQAVDIRSAVRRARYAVQSRYDRARFVRDVLVPTRLKVQKESMLHYNGMLIGPYQVLDAKRETVMAGSRYIDELAAFWDARAALDQLLSGSLTSTRSTSSAMAADASPEKSHD